MSFSMGYKQGHTSHGWEISERLYIVRSSLPYIYNLNDTTLHQTKILDSFSKLMINTDWVPES